MSTDVSSSGTGVEAALSTSRGRRPRQNFETWSWFFMRVSGLVLVFLSLLHFAITHIINDVI